MISERCVDLLYLAYNRIEFTKETFSTLLSNTDWQFVHELFVYDDGSCDGTREWLENNISQVPVTKRMIKSNFGSPIAIMLHFIQSAHTPILAKTDNDAMLPPAWLAISLDVLDSHPELLLLGIEAMYPGNNDIHLAQFYTSADFVSGLGLYRRSVFERGLFAHFEKYYGFEEWQIAQGNGLTRGWITPSIPVFLLDRFPFEPWLTYSNAYIQLGWQRSWTKHDRNSKLWYWRWSQQTDNNKNIGTKISFSPIHPPAYKIIILSKYSENLIFCLQSVLANEPEILSENIIVVDDGARTEADKKLPPIRWIEGKSPFVYCRNLNIGIREAESDVIILDDDAHLLTACGFFLLSIQVRSRTNLGNCSAGIQGAISNSNQIASQSFQYRLLNDMISFVCVYISRVVYEKVGSIDECLTGYGLGDYDYCIRALAAGFQISVWDGCVVRHLAEQASTYWKRPDFGSLFEQNRQIFREKWGKDA